MPYKSAKQRRLMQAVAHNPAFAKKVGIPQSVGQKFEEHKAEGGKVSTINELMWMLKRLEKAHDPEKAADSLLGMSSEAVVPKYHEHPSLAEMPVEDARPLSRYSGWEGPELNKMLRGEEFHPRLTDEDLLHLTNSLDSLAGRYVLKHDMPMYRGIRGVPIDDILKNPEQGFSSWSTDHRIAHDFASNVITEDGLSMRPLSGDRAPRTILLMEAKKDYPGIPIHYGPNSAPEKEVLFPREMRYEQLDDPVKIGPVDYVPVKTRWAEGGEVADKKSKNALGTISKIARSLSRSEENKAANQRVFAGLMKQLYGLDKNGEPAFLGGLDMDPNPGIVDEVLALPTVLPDKYVPEVSKQAQHNLEILNDKVNRDMGLPEAHGFRERGQEALGTMLGQIPVAGSKAPKLAEEGVKAVKGSKMADNFMRSLEWFTPTVEPSVPNYVTGTAVGGGLGGTADTLGDVLNEEPPPKIPLRRGQGGLVHFGKGGKVEALVDAVKKLKQKVMASDDGVPHTEVYKAISKISDDHEVPMSHIIDLLDNTPIPERRLSLDPVTLQPHPERRATDILVKAAKLREQLEGPVRWLNAPIQGLSQQGREDLATTYAHALNAHDQVAAQPSTEALGMYENLVNQFTQMADPYKPQKAMGGAIHKCSCQE